MTKKLHLNPESIRIELQPDPRQGGFFATHPDLPGCNAQGETANEAVANLVRARELWLAAKGYILGKRNVRGLATRPWKACHMEDNMWFQERPGVYIEDADGWAVITLDAEDFGWHEDQNESVAMMIRCASEIVEAVNNRQILCEAMYGSKVCVLMAGHGGGQHVSNSGTSWAMWEEAHGIKAKS